MEKKTYYLDELVKMAREGKLKEGDKFKMICPETGYFFEYDGEDFNDKHGTVTLTESGIMGAYEPVSGGIERIARFDIYANENGTLNETLKSKINELVTAVNALRNKDEK